jgi:hypothetical protein
MATVDFTLKAGDHVEVIQDRAGVESLLLHYGTVERVMKSRYRVVLSTNAEAGGWRQDFRTKDNVKVGQERGAPRVHIRRAELVLLQVSIEWGRHWTGSWLEPTPGKGIYVTVMEQMVFNNDPRRNTHHFPSFDGCPLGSYNAEDHGDLGDDSVRAVELAISDFINRGRPEWRGKRPLSRVLVEIERTRDDRQSKERKPETVY